MREKRVPAITHVDGTARLQTVSKESDSLFHGLIAAFDQRTSIPLLLNTSFNLRGMPIVESPLDAVQCFLLTDLDCMYIGQLRVDQPDVGKFVPSVREGWRIVSEHERGPHQIIRPKLPAAKSLLICQQ